MRANTEWDRQFALKNTITTKNNISSDKSLNACSKTEKL